MNFCSRLMPLTVSYRLLTEQNFKNFSQVSFSLRNKILGLGDLIILLPFPVSNTFITKQSAVII